MLVFPASSIVTALGVSSSSTLIVPLDGTAVSASVNVPDGTLLNVADPPEFVVTLLSYGVPSFPTPLSLNVTP